MYFHIDKRRALHRARVRSIQVTRHLSSLRCSLTSTASNQSDLNASVSNNIIRKAQLSFEVMSSLEYDRLASTSTRDPYQANAIIQELRSVVQNFQSGLDKIGNRSFREQGTFMYMQFLSTSDSKCLGVQCEDLNSDKTAPKHVQGR